MSVEITFSPDFETWAKENLLHGYYFVKVRLGKFSMILRMMYYSVLTQANSEKRNSECSYQGSNLRPSDCTCTSPDALPLSYRRLVGAIKLGFNDIVQKVDNLTVFWQHYKYVDHRKDKQEPMASVHFSIKLWVLLEQRYSENKVLPVDSIVSKIKY